MRWRAYAKISVPEPSVLFANSLDRIYDNRRSDAMENFPDRISLGFLGHLDAVGRASSGSLRLPPRDDHWNNNRLR